MADSFVPDVKATDSFTPDVQGDSFVPDGVQDSFVPDAATPLAPVAQVARPASSLIRRAVADPLLDLASGLIAVPKDIVGLGSIVTGGHIGRGVDTGFDKAGLATMSEASEFWQDLKSPEAKEAQRRVSEAEGFTGKVAAAVRNPSTIGSAVIQSAPGMLAGGGMARGATKLVPKLAPIAMGLGEGLIGAGASAENIRESSPDKLLSLKQSGLAAASGIGTAALGVMGGKLAAKLKIADPDAWMAGIATPETALPLWKRVIGGAVSEGLFEELPQSVQEQMLQNEAMGKPVMEGVAESAAMGWLSGGVMGGGVNLISRGGRPPTSIQPAPLPAPAPTPTPAPIPATVEPIIQREAPAPVDAKRGYEGGYEGMIDNVDEKVQRNYDNLRSQGLSHEDARRESWKQHYAEQEAKKNTTSSLSESQNAFLKMDATPEAKAESAMMEQWLNETDPARKEILFDELNKLSEERRATPEGIAFFAAMERESAQNAQAGQPAPAAPVATQPAPQVPPIIERPTEATTPISPRPETGPVPPQAVAPTDSPARGAEPLLPPTLEPAVKRPNEPGSPGGAVLSRFSIPEFVSDKGKRLIQDMIKRNENADRVPFPEWSKLSTDQQRDILSRGFVIDVNRMGKPILGVSQNARTEALREAVKAKQSISPPEPAATQPKSAQGAEAKVGASLPASPAPSTAPAAGSKVAPEPTSSPTVADIDGAITRRKRDDLMLAKGEYHAPGLRLGDRESAGGMAYLVEKGEATIEDWNNWIAEARRRNQFTDLNAPVRPPVLADRPSGETVTVSPEKARPATPVDGKPVLRKTGDRMAGAGVAGQKSASALGQRVALLRALNAKTDAYPDETFDGIDPSQIDEVRDYMIEIQRGSPTGRAGAGEGASAAQPPAKTAQTPAERQETLKQTVKAKRKAASSSGDRIADKVLELGGLRHYAKDPSTGKRPHFEETQRLVRYIRGNGLTLDRMLEQLKGDPEVAGMVADWSENDLYEHLAKRKGAKTTVAQYDPRDEVNSPRDFINRMKSEPYVTRNATEISDGALIWMNGEWHKASEDTQGDGVVLKDGTTTTIGPEQDIKAKGIIRKSDPAYRAALKEYQAQEAGREPSKDDLTLESETPEMVKAREAADAKRVADKAAEDKRLADEANKAESDRKKAEARKVLPQDDLQGDLLGEQSLFAPPTPKRTVDAKETPATRQAELKAKVQARQHVAIYNGKELPAGDFKQASQRVSDNLSTGEHGYVRAPDGKLYEIASDKRSAVLVKEMQTKQQRDIAQLEERIAKAKYPNEREVLSKRLESLKAESADVAPASSDAPSTSVGTIFEKGKVGKPGYGKFRITAPDPQGDADYFMAQKIVAGKPVGEPQLMNVGDIGQRVNEKAKYKTENENGEAVTDAITGRPTRITGRMVRDSDAKNIYMEVASLNQRHEALPRIGRSSLDNLRGGMASEIGRGRELVAYKSNNAEVVYKVFRVRQDGTTGLMLRPHTESDGKVNMVESSGTLDDMLAKIEATNRLGGVPTEIVGITDDGELVVKQPYSPDAVASEFPAQMNQSGAVQIPYDMTKDSKWRLWVVAIDGKPMLVSDLLPNNFRSDRRGDDRISDLSITPVPQELLDNPKWKPYIEQALSQEKSWRESVADFRTTEDDAPQASQDSALKIVRQVLGANADVSIVERIFEQGKDRLGKYQSGLVTIANKGDMERTAWHEAYHGAEDMLFTDAERASAEAIEANEEKRADAFMEYAATHKGVSGKLQGLFDRLMYRIKALFGKAGKLDELRALHARIMSGEMARRVAREGTGEAKYQRQESTDAILANNMDSVMSSILDRKPISVELAKSAGITIAPDGYEQSGSMYVVIPDSPLPKPMSIQEQRDELKRQGFRSDAIEQVLIGRAKRLNSDSASGVRYRTAPAADEMASESVIKAADRVSKTAAKIQKYIVNNKDERTDATKDEASFALDYANLIDQLRNDIQSLHAKAVAEGGKEVKAQTNLVVDAVRRALPMSERGKMLVALKKVSDAKTAEEALGKLQDLAEQWHKSFLVQAINQAYRKAINSPSIDIVWRKKIQSIIDGHSFRNPSDETLRKAQEMRDFLATEKGKEFLQPTGNRKVDRTIQLRVLSLLNTLDTTPLQELDVAMLQEKLDEIRRAISIGRLAQDVKSSEEAKQKLEDIRRLKAAQTNPWNLKERITTGPNKSSLTLTDNAKNVLINAHNIVAHTYNYSMGPVRQFMMLDNWKEMGEHFKTFMAPLLLRENRYQKAVRPVLEGIKKIVDKYKLTTQDVRDGGIYAAAKQEGGMEKLELLGYDKANVDATVARFERNVGGKALYDYVRKSFDELRPELRRVLAETYNLDMKEVDAYIPFMTDFALSDDQEVTTPWDDITLNQATGKYDVQTSANLRQNIQKQWAKSRTGAGKQKINLDLLYVATKRLQDMHYFVHMAAEAKRLGELANTDAYKAIAGDEGQRFVRQYIDTVARRGGTTSVHNIRMLDKIINNLGVGVLGYRISTILIQPTSMFNAMGLIGHRAVTGVADMLNPKYRHFVIDNMPEITSGAGGDISLRESRDSLQLGKWRKRAMNPIIWTDLMTRAGVAWGAYQKYMADHKLELDLTKPNEDAIQYAQGVASQTQASGSYMRGPLLIARGMIGNSKTLTRALTQFQSYPMNTFHLMVTDGIMSGIKNKDYVKLARIVMGVQAAFLAEGLVRTGLLSVIGGSDAEDKKDLEEYLLANQARNQIGGIPLLGSWFTAAQYDSMPMPIAETLRKVVKGFRSSIEAKTPAAKARGSVKMVGAASALAGIPGVSQAAQIAGRRIKSDKEETTEYIRQSTRGLPPGMRPDAVSRAAIRAYQQGRQTDDIPKNEKYADFLKKYKASYTRLTKKVDED